MEERRSPIVSIEKLNTYEPKAVVRALEAVLEPLGGIGTFVRSGSRVVLKPNFLAAKKTEAAVCTHPEVIRAVAQLARSAGAAEVIVTDSPAVVSASRVAKNLELGDDEPFVVADADEGMEMLPEEASFYKLGLCRRIVEAETLINLPKAKTHGQMVMTGAVKNCFGAVMGMEKVQWHYRAGRDPEAFARLLVHVHSLVAPQLNLLDAVVGMEGNGPGSGKPRSLGFLAAATDAHALDKVFAHILGLENHQVYTLAVGESLGLVPPTLDHIEVIGPELEELKPDPPWAMAAPKILRDIGAGEWLAPILDRLFTLSPKIDKKLCTGCGQCKLACAADAIAIVGNKSKEGKLALVNKKSCIACFCCQEICPEGAITVSAGFVARLLGLGLRR